MNNVETLVIDNFKGSMTSFLNGNINSGFSDVTNTFGNDPYTYPGRLSWNEEPTLIDSSSSIVTDLILATKQRIESGITYVYAVGHTARIYKIQVNDPTTYNPDYDNPVLLTTLTDQTPTFTRGAFLEFYGTTEKIYIGHDKGVSSINFDGTGEAFVGLVGSWTQSVPRPFTQFTGNLCIGNGENIAIIDATGTVTSYARLSPSFPRGSQVRDLDVTPDGTYLEATVSTLALPDIIATTTQASLIASKSSYIFKWNGTDTGYTSFISYPNATLSANIISGPYNYVFGYDSRGGCVYNPLQKVLSSTLTSTFSEPPYPNAVFFQDNLVFFASTLPFEGNSEAIACIFGSYDFEVGPGYWAPLGLVATSPETDVIRIPMFSPVSSFAQGATSNGYTNGIFGFPKVYFSTIETSVTPTTRYRLYKWNPTPTGLGVATSGGIYQTQNQKFSKKIQVKELRVYGSPWIANNSFSISLIGSTGAPIQNGTYTFTTGSTLTAGKDFAWWNPQIAPTYTLGIRVTNIGTKNFVLDRIEIDYTAGGK